MTPPRATDRHVLPNPAEPLARMSEAQLTAALRPLHLVADLAERRAAEEMRTWRFQSFEALQLQHGRFFSAPAGNRVRRHGPSGTCFANATAHSDTTGLAYVEGVAGPVWFPLGVQHAWCVDDSGRVVDPTWPTDEPRFYFGVPVTAAFRRTVPHPALLHFHDAGKALLRDGIPAGALADVGQPVPALLRQTSGSQPVW